MKKGILTLTVLLLLAAALGFLAGPVLAERGMQLLYPRPYADIVEREAAEFDLDQNLVYAVIRAESRFDPNARSRAGAVGLMQLTDQTYRWISSLYPPETTEGDIADPRVNVHCGCALLRLLLDQYGSQEVALCAYNAGMGNVSDWLSREEYSDNGRTLHTIPYPETGAYVKRVGRNYAWYVKLYGED